MLVITTFFVCMAAIVALRPVCIRFDHVDKPGGHKLHENPTPLCGGIAVVLSFVVIGSVFAWSWAYAGLVFGLITMALLGAVDDRNHVPFGWRLLIQSIALLIGMIFMGGVELRELGPLLGQSNTSLGVWAVPFTLFAAVGAINAINMVDGLDGLAGGFSFLVLLLFVVVVPANSQDFSILCVAIGCVVGFLAFNLRSPWRSRASVFLGDSGSLALGFLLSWFAIDLSQGSAAPLRPITIVWVFGLPLLDTVSLMSSRALRGQNPMAADRNHFHHLLLRMGLTPAHAVYVWLLSALTLMVIGLVGQIAEVPETFMTGGFVAIFAVYTLYISRVKRLPSSKPDRKPVNESA